MKRDEQMERLHDILLGAERLLDPQVQGPGAGLRERIEQVIERGWDSSSAALDSAGAAGATAPAPDPVPAAPPSDPESAAPPRSPLDPDQRRARLEELRRQILVCESCPLALGRSNAVPGEGVLDPLVMVVGEGPGYNEDQQGRPFVGKAGQYLDAWLESIGLHRERNAFIANIVKCRPPNNRDPKPEESDACAPYLREQIALVQPRLIMTVGRISTRILTGATQGITRIHGTFYRYEGIPLVPTFHPSAVLRNQDYRRPVWEDLKKIRNWLIDNAGHQTDGSD